MSLEGKKSVGPESIISHSGTEDDVIIKVEPVECTEKESCSSTVQDVMHMATTIARQRYSATFPSMVSATQRQYPERNQPQHFEQTSLDQSLDSKTAFDCFRNQILGSIKVEYPNSSDEEAYQIAAKRWNLLSNEQKKSFISKGAPADVRDSHSSFTRLRGVHYDVTGNEDHQNSSHDGKKFGKCTWCKNFGNLNDYSSNLQGREIYCTGLCSKSCFEQAALKILNVEAGYGLETTSFPASVPIRTSLDSISRHEHRLSRDRCKDRRFYDRPQYEDDQTRFDAASNGAAQLSPVIKTPPFNESSQTYWNIENVKSLRPGEVVNSAKQDINYIVTDGAFDWNKYVKRTGSSIAPPSCFRQTASISTLLQTGMKVETKDPMQASVYCLATVVNVIGSRVRLHLDGCSSRDDVWLLCDSRDIRPVGWCKEEGLSLQKPKGLSIEGESYVDFVKRLLSSGDAAPRSAFRDEPPHPKGNGFESGMKLEAVDKTNPAVIGIATVAEVDGDRVWIEFDGHEGSGYGTWYWDADLLNAGWCYANRHPLRPPGFKSIRPRVGNAHSEISTVRVSPTLSERNCRQMPKAGEVDVHINNDCYPGPFLDPEKVACLRSTYKGHIAVVLKIMLESLVRCAYNEKTVFGFLKPGGGSIEINTVSDGRVYNCCLPNVDRVSSFWKVMEQFCDSLRCCSNLVSGFKLQSTCPQCGRGSNSKIHIGHQSCNKRPSSEQTDQPACVSSTPDSTAVTTAELSAAAKNAPFSEAPKRRYVNSTYSHIVTSPRTWTADEVAKLVASTDLKEYVDLFRENDIDGKALLLLQRDIIINYMGLKIGPAVKLLEMIDDLKEIESRFR